MTRIIIRNGTVLDATGERRADVAITNGVITAVEPSLDATLDTDATVLDAFGQADAWIGRAISSIAAILFHTGLINLDFATLRRTFTPRGGKTLFGLGQGA